MCAVCARVYVVVSSDGQLKSVEGGRGGDGGREGIVSY